MLFYTTMALFVLAVIVPPVIVGGVALAALVRAGGYELAERRRATGLCVGCGYDLRESRDVCPECGGPR